MKLSLLRVAAMAAIFFGIGIGSANAGDWPDKPITLIVGYTPGGSLDLISRIIAPELGKRLGQSVIVENIGGAGGTIGANKVVIAKPDGYTLMLASGSEVSIARLTNPAVPYDGSKDLAPITLTSVEPMVLIGNKSLPAKNIEQLLTLAKSKPGRLTYASSGVGTPLNLAGELMKQLGHVNITHVPYRGAASMSNDLLGGQVNLGVFALSSALPFIKSGQVTVYGVTSAKRSPLAPNIPALAEDPVLKNMDMGLWFGIMGPRGLPAPIIQRLNTELHSVLAMPSVQQKLNQQGVTVQVEGPDAFAKFIRAETAKYKAIVDAAGLRS